MNTRLRPPLFAAILTATAGAALAGPYDKQVNEIIDAAVTDWTAALSCSVLEANTHENVLRWWNAELEDLAEILADDGLDLAPAFVAEINERLAMDRLTALTRGDAPTLIAFCMNTDWQQQMALMRITSPAREIRDRLDD